MYRIRQKVCNSKNATVTLYTPFLRAHTVHTQWYFVVVCPQIMRPTNEPSQIGETNRKRERSMRKRTLSQLLRGTSHSNIVLLCYFMNESKQQKVFASCTCIQDRRFCLVLHTSNYLLGGRAVQGILKIEKDRPTSSLKKGAARNFRET